jgi:hypothetical protein
MVSAQVIDRNGGRFIHIDPLREGKHRDLVDAHIVGITALTESGHGLSRAKPRDMGAHRFNDSATVNAGDRWQRRHRGIGASAGHDIRKINRSRCHFNQHLVFTRRWLFDFFIFKLINGTGLMNSNGFHGSASCDGIFKAKGILLVFDALIDLE